MLMNMIAGALLVTTLSQRAYSTFVVEPYLLLVLSNWVGSILV